MNTKQKTNWWIDLVLFTGFITTFFLNLTGVIVHQWVGIFSGILAALHLFLHADWIGAVSIRFFDKTSGRMRVYFLLDGLLMFGFAVIIFTGLVISTWLNLPLMNYITWLDIHIAVSIATLALLLLKLALHQRRIAYFIRKTWMKPSRVPLRNTAAQPARAASELMERRQFLQIMGVVGTASFVALVSASRGLAENLASSEETLATEDTGTTVETAARATSEATATAEASATAEATTAATATSEVTATEQATATQIPATGTVTLNDQASSSSSDCRVQCNHNCSYPGHCRRYVDTNNNNRCDLSECI